MELTAISEMIETVFLLKIGNPYIVTKQNLERNPSIDFLRFLSLIAVILIHISGVILYKPEIDIWWQFSNFISSSLRFCVPIFVMITGALFLNRELNFFVFLKRNYFARILVPFLFWYLVYYFFAPEIDLVHFWYVYMLLGLYLFIPMLSDFIKNYTKNEVLSIIMASGLFILLNENYNFIQLPAFIKFIPYLLLGYYLNKYFSLKKFSPIILGAFLFVISSSIIFYATYLLSKSAGVFDSSFLEYLTVFVALQSIGIFILFQNINIKNPVIDIINKHSYGIYLSHILVIYTLGDFGIYHSTINPVIGGILTLSATLIISAVCISILNKVPFVGSYISGSK